MTLTTVEASFRALKTELGIRPIYHQLAERTEAHLFISVLAYHLLINTEHCLREHGDARRWSTIREQLSTHQRSTMVLIGEDNQIYHIRVSGTPEKIHQDTYLLLGVKDTLRMRKNQFGPKVVVT